MSDSIIDSLFAVIGADPALQAQCRHATTTDELRQAITATGIDPDHPEIATTVFGMVELDEHDLAASTGGLAPDLQGAVIIQSTIDELVGWK